MQVVIRQKAQTAMQSAPSKSYAWTITWPTQGACAVVWLVDLYASALFLCVYL